MDSGASPRRVPHVRLLQPPEVAKAADVLAQAFDDDPVADFIFRSDSGRARGLRRFFTIQLRHLYLPYGEVWTTGGGPAVPEAAGAFDIPDVAGVAMWSPPDRPAFTRRDRIRMLPILGSLLSGRQPLEALRLLAAVDAARPRRPLWYLATLGTAPVHQARGIGSSLLGPVLRRADVEGTESYLESSKESNIAFYHHHGFEVVEEIRTSRAAPTLWAMLRQPRPSDR